ncbi:hypothetical protein [Streptomyces pseudovenezuelae]|uniref:hypothetical protein n=1 Tax=Streptomyces pseudovenezuelae TaxID=67350 RepID=UPI002E3522EA|nr:hypothetical protein [Streptomyces pseudovenezuelae]
MSTTDALKDFELVIRQQVSQEGREPVSEDRITLLKIRQLVAEYHLDHQETEAGLQSYSTEAGNLKEQYTWDDYDSAKDSAGEHARESLGRLLALLEELLP